ncbi:uncharacterized protein TRAVEDRAFT_23983 [Trametes versicolor FP-101664 SS1]|uniref:uncharacterized protein n=1 Tax=Trametes versicolor (strain FP-101664) TaxID=717944 RepID=UPI000462440A|nr:uncharacterized protein TRAVEDRAFT_23983 [Trametes versicolor FP-101664 SS1]EIW53749.1 hypothetical protein TRAVEDRAFT_23983 [Trametes versicolor FP-101664 SS1]
MSNIALTVAETVLRSGKRFDFLFDKMSIHMVTWKRELETAYANKPSKKDFIVDGLIALCEIKDPKTNKSLNDLGAHIVEIQCVFRSTVTMPRYLRVVGVANRSTLHTGGLDPTEPEHFGAQFIKKDGKRIPFEVPTQNPSSSVKPISFTRHVYPPELVEALALKEAANAANRANQAGGSNGPEGGEGGEGSEGSAGAVSGTKSA